MLGAKGLANFLSQLHVKRGGCIVRSRALRRISTNEKIHSTQLGLNFIMRATCLSCLSCLTDFLLSPALLMNEGCFYIAFCDISCILFLSNRETPNLCEAYIEHERETLPNLLCVITIKRVG